jgi:hypothetical protein
MPIEIVTGAAAQANVVSLPASVIMYGPPGTEKTTDAARAFTMNGRCNAFFIPCEDGALKNIAARGFPVPDHPRQTVKSWGAMVEALSWLYEHKQNYVACVIDGLSPFSSYIYKEAEDQHKGNKNKFMVPVQVRNCLFQLREFIRSLGLHSVFIAHPLPPAVQDGVFYPGKFALSPKTLVGDFFGHVDTVLRVDHLTLPGRTPMRVYYTGGEQWPADLGTFGQPQDWRFWWAKNREGVGQAVVPADLGVFLRARQPPYGGL